MHYILYATYMSAISKNKNKIVLKLGVLTHDSSNAANFARRSEF